MFEIKFHDFIVDFHKKTTAKKQDFLSKVSRDDAHLNKSKLKLFLISELFHLLLQTSLL